MKLARKLKAFLMMRCARTLVEMADGGLRFVERINAEEVEDEGGCSAASCSLRLAAGSMEIPMTTSPCGGGTGA